MLPGLFAWEYESRLSRETPDLPMTTSKVRPLDPNDQPQLALAFVSSLESGAAATVFGNARLRRQLSREQVAQRSGLTTEQVTWLEEGRVYAFRNPEDALAAALLLASGLEIDNHEARELAGLPVLPRPIERNRRGRLVAAVALMVVGIAAAAMLGYALRGSATRVFTSGNGKASLPATWKVKVVVENGGGDINYTRRVASRIASFGYQIASVKRASRFDYKRTTIFFASVGNGKALGERLASRLEADLLPLPNGEDPLRLLVIVGPATLGPNG
jgi:transcriptional regulator with XRE-family HTH domain